jgi:pyroglutamyl-peptidase
MATILLTGFEPFGGFQSNPSQIIAERLDGETVGGAQIIGLTLPVEFGRDTEPMFQAIAQHRPSLVLSLGLNAGATCLDVERFAVNSKKTEQIGREERIINDGFAALFATINVEQVAGAICAAGIPAQAHPYAGAYLCNHILYQTLHYAQKWNLRCRAGFIHLPLSCEQVMEAGMMSRPSLPLETMITGIRAAMEAALHGKFELG